MPMDDGLLTKNILDTIRLNMKAISVEAEPTEFQEELAGAVAKGVINTLKTLQTLGAGNVFTGLSGVGLFTDGNLMALTATNAMVGFSGGGGIALSKIMEALMLPVSLHLSTNTEIKSISGFGGQGGPPLGAVPPAFEVAIFAAFPQRRQQEMTKSPQGLLFIKAISLGLSAGVSVGIPAFVPMGSTPPPPGVLVGIFQ